MTLPPDQDRTAYVAGEPAAPRLETDALGEKAVPAGAYYGGRTARALDRFRISGRELRSYPGFIRALGMVKLAGVRSTFEFGRLSAELQPAIEEACQELIDGHRHDQFRLDVLQGGAGAATNTNANEVIANRALELLGHARGEYAYCDPQDHVNGPLPPAVAYQAALQVALALGNMELIAEVKRLIAALRAKSVELAPLFRVGRPPLPEGASITVGQELSAFAETLAGEIRALVAIQRVLREVRLDGPAPEAGRDSPLGFPRRYVGHLARIAGLPIHLAHDPVDATRDRQALILYSSCLKSLAIGLSRICSELRLLSAGPRDVREIDLPPTLAETAATGGGEAAIPEVVNMVCFRVIGSDLAVTLASEAGPLQRNVFTPVIAACLLEAQTTCLNATRTLRVHCVEGITGNPGRLAAHDPTRGYDRAGELVAEVMKTGRGIVELLSQKEHRGEEPHGSLNPSDPGGAKRSRRRGGNG
jgi:aspartate ammonia-lyase